MTSDTLITQPGTCANRKIVPNWEVVSDRIIHSSHAEKRPVLAAVAENSKLAQALRCLSQMSRCIPAKVRHADAAIDQMMVIQLICAKD